MLESHPIQYAFHGAQFLIYDTVFEDKEVLTACGIGRVEGQDVRLTNAGQGTFRALCECVADTGGQASSIRFQEIVAIDVAGLRVLNALAEADEKQVLFFVCLSPDVYDTAVEVLNVQWLSPRAVH